MPKNTAVRASSAIASADASENAGGTAAEKMPMRGKLADALRVTVPVMAGYLVLGIGFGMVLRSRGLGLPWSLGMSLFIYAGSMEYVAVDLMTEGAQLLTAALTALAVNARHLFYSLSMVEKYRGKRHKAFLIFGLTDETYSLVCDDRAASRSRAGESYYLLVTLFDYLYWLIGSALGSVLGAVLPINTEGIDFALTALFLTVFTEQWLTTENHLAAAVGVAASLLCLLCFGSESFLIPAMLLIAGGLILLRNREGICNE